MDWFIVIFIAFMVLCGMLVSALTARLESTRKAMLGFLLCLGGVILILLGLADAMVPGHGLVAVLFWPGVIALGIGVRMSRRACRKICPQCTKRLKFEANECGHCGYEFDTIAAISQSFNKGVR